METYADVVQFSRSVALFSKKHGSVVLWFIRIELFFGVDPLGVMVSIFLPQLLGCVPCKNPRFSVLMKS